MICQSPAVHHHLLIYVERPNVADSYQALVPVPRVALAGYFLPPDQPLKGLFRQYAALLLFALASFASLLHFGGVDAVEPDLGFANVDGVAVNDAGLASDVGKGKGWEREDK